ncbi:TBC1 domain family member 22B [Nibea albiflora]|uniref:TBC1 domain family member 22B n=1 Tax=Nibea albiflora TaxID=240163 RepID=A0ACB7EY57_NIBAL|nr:TBC1 domain family member 22B [Nibea albiflora]
MNSAYMQLLVEVNRWTKRSSGGEVKERKGLSVSGENGQVQERRKMQDSAEPEGFSHFHLYVCAAFLVRWRKEILEERDFQGLMILLQNLPTMHWGNEEVSVLLAEAYRLKFAFADAPNHYKR